MGRRDGSDRPTCRNAARWDGSTYWPWLSGSSATGAWTCSERRTQTGRADHEGRPCGAQFCEVRIDPDTGEVRVSRWTGVFDVGRVINAKTASSQIRGMSVRGSRPAIRQRRQVEPRVIGYLVVDE